VLELEEVAQMSFLELFHEEVLCVKKRCLMVELANALHDYSFLSVEELIAKVLKKCGG
jgi:hypothetical protein